MSTETTASTWVPGSPEAVRRQRTNSAGNPSWYPVGEFSRCPGTGLDGYGYPYPCGAPLRSGCASCEHCGQPIAWPAPQLDSRDTRAIVAFVSCSLRESPYHRDDPTIQEVVRSLQRGDDPVRVMTSALLAYAEQAAKIDAGFAATAAAMITASGDDPVVITESEANAVALRAACRRDGLRAVILGAPDAHWRNSWCPMLAGRDVALAANDDDAGDGFVARIAPDIQRVARSVHRWRPVDAKDWCAAWEASLRAAEASK